MKTITDLLTIRSASDPRDRECLLTYVLGKPREWLLAHPEAPVRPASAARYHRLLARLRRGAPLPYLLGERWFHGRPFTVNRHVLIPRPETEAMIELALDHIQKYRIPNTEYRILDIGTGSGCIAVTLAAELPQVHIIATDASPAALRVARVNARQHGIADRIVFRRGDLLEPIMMRSLRARHTPRAAISAYHWTRLLRLRARNDTECVVLANLPYLTTAEWRTLPRSIRDYEPRQAFDGGPDGLKYYHELFAQLVGLTPYALRLTALLEIDPRRKRSLTALIRKTLPGWRASWHRDLAHRWRVLGLQQVDL